MIRWIPALILITVALSGAAAEPVTATDPSVAESHLKIRLKPLTLDELQAEADAWRELLQAKATAVGEAAIQLQEAEGDEQALRTETLTALQEERTRLADRLQIAIHALAAKGGEVEGLQKYLDTVTRIDVTTQSASSSALAFRGWLTSREGGIRLGINTLRFLGILLIAYLAARVVSRIVRRALGPTRLSDLLKNFVCFTVHKVLFVLGILVALSALGVNIVPLVAGVGVIGFVVGFALQDTLSNFASGFMILLYRPYDVGDVVIAGGVNGIVDDMTLVSTRIKTFDNQIVTVPNSSIWGGTITNATGSSTRRVDLTFGIGYGDNVDRAEQILRDIAEKHEKVLDDPPVTIRLHELADSSVNFIVRPWARTEDYWAVYWGITRAVKERFDQAGISIPFPQQDVHLYRSAEG